MWSAILTLCGGRLDCNIPAWLVEAWASQRLMDFGRQIAAELRRDPDAYGYVRDSRYEVIAQLWDAARDNVPSIALGRRRIGHEAVFLIPDSYFTHTAGYESLRREAPGGAAWAARRPVVAWRGSVTGEYHERFQDLPRIRLATICRDLPFTDVGLISVHETMATRYDLPVIEAHIQAERLSGTSWRMKQFGDYRYSLDVDGHANAWGFLEKLILGCCVLKVESEYEQWYYRRIKPWVHYVPVAPDMSDLAEKIDWCLANDAQCEWIGANAAAFGASLDFASQLRYSCRTFLAAADETRP